MLWPINKLCSRGRHPVCSLFQQISFSQKLRSSPTPWGQRAKNQCRRNWNVCSAFASVTTNKHQVRIIGPWLWRHQMETFSASLALCEGNPPVTSGFPQRPVTRRFGAFFDLRLNKRLSKQSRLRWFEATSDPLWRHCNALLHVVHSPCNGSAINAASVSMSWHLHGMSVVPVAPLQWRYNEHDGVSNHQPNDCLLTRLFRRRSKKTSKLQVTSLCAGNSPVTGEFRAQRASNAENVSTWWRHHVIRCPCNHWTHRTRYLCEKMNSKITSKPKGYHPLFSDVVCLMPR